VVAGQDQAQYHVYAAPAYDEFDNWSLARGPACKPASVSSRYVSPYVVGYEDLDGIWIVAQCTAVWQLLGATQTCLRDGAPYHNGHWGLGRPVGDGAGWMTLRGGFCAVPLWTVGLIFGDTWGLGSRTPRR